MAGREKLGFSLHSLSVSELLEYGRNIFMEQLNENVNENATVALNTNRSIIKYDH